MPLDPTVWHYHRVDDARRYIDVLDTGISNSLTLFAPRRRGKTALVLHDIRPIAMISGYNVVYCTFWDNKPEPARALLTAIEHVENRVTLPERLKRQLKGRIKQFDLGAADFSVSVHLKEDDTDRDVLQKISVAFTEIAKAKRKTLFLLDEVQHLATDSAFEPLVATIRSAFDKYPEKLCAIYTGSSRNGLHALFRDKKSALFNASQEYPLPDMGSAFIEFVLHRFSEASGRKVSPARALRVWQQVDKSPYEFMNILEYMLTNIEDDIEKAREVCRERSLTSSPIAKAISGLKPLERALLLMIHEGESSLFSKESLAKLADALGTDSVSKSAVQKTVGALKEKELIVQNGPGDYDIEDRIGIDLLLN